MKEGKKRKVGGREKGVTDEKKKDMMVKRKEATVNEIQEDE